MPKFLVLTCKKTSLILRYVVNTKSNESLTRETTSNYSEMAKMEQTLQHSYTLIVTNILYFTILR